MAIDPTLADLAQNAYVTARAASRAEKELSAYLRIAIARMLPPGTVIDLTQKPLPDHLRCVDTISGSSRGTRKFRIEKIIWASADPTNLSSSSWSCDATPISEKTGKDMSGRPGNSWGDSKTVRIKGQFGTERTINEPSEEINRRVMETITAAMAEPLPIIEEAL